VPDESIAALAKLIRDNQPCVGLTGAGISQESGIQTFRGPDYVPEKVRNKAKLSTESGIPDLRSPTGIWASFDPREYATLGAFRREESQGSRRHAESLQIGMSPLP
jgi:NAD-dependent SIR2 family protein deacetylase